MVQTRRRLPHTEPTDPWGRALADLHEALALFRPVQAAFNKAESAWFAVRNERTADHDAVQHYAKARLDEATEQERRFGNALFDAASTLYRTPAPHLEGLIEKIEMVRKIGYDGSVEQLVLQDLRALAGSG